MEKTISKEVKIPIESVNLEGELVIPEKATSIVLFSHGSGSSRHSPRNKQVAKSLQKRGIATLLFDLLTYQEDQNYSSRFDIELLTQRLIAVTKWIRQEDVTKEMSIGYFGSSTGAASALTAASVLSKDVHAVVSRGGRPDLAMPFLPDVKSATLLIVGGNDGPVIEMNQQAFTELNTPNKKMEIIEGATHLFEEPGKLEIAAELAGKWFQKFLT